MAHERSRYFPNQYAGDGVVECDTELQKSKIIPHIESILKHLKASSRDSSKGLYTGTAGVAYAFYYVAKCGQLPECKEQLLTEAQNYIDAALNETIVSARRQVGLLSGNGGVYAAAALIYNECGDSKKCNEYLERYKSLASYCEPLDFLEDGSDELFVGRAGYLLGLILLQRDLKTEVLTRDQVDQLLLKTVESGKSYRTTIRSDLDFPLMYRYHGKPYLGSAHGFAGILQVLLSFPAFLKSNPDVAELVRKSVDFLLDQCMQDGNVATNLDGALNKQGKHLVHWCHGAAGVIYTFARAYLVFGKKEKYLKACRELADTVWQKGLLKKGPGICHGVSGSGYVFLLMYRLTGEAKYLYRAERFANFMFTEQFKNESREPDRPFSLFEGVAGTVCFLNDLMRADRSEFPLCNVFIENS